MLKIEGDGRFERWVLAGSLWTMALIYFFLSLGLSSIVDGWAKHLEYELKVALPIGSYWSFYVFMEWLWLAVAPVVIAEFLLGIGILNSRVEKIGRQFLAGFFIWLLGFAGLSLCFMFAAAPAGATCIIYKFTNVGGYVIPIVVIFVLPPVLVLLLCYRAFLKKPDSSK